MYQNTETFQDQLLNFSIPDRNVRGRIVRHNAVIEQVLSAHDYPEPIKHLLAEALLLASLMGSLLKEDGAQLTMQAQTEDGPVRLLVADYRRGELRGYADFDQDELKEIGVNPPLTRMFRNGRLAITFETGKGHRYQGIILLEGASLAEACERYFFQSEQIPTLLRLGIRLHGEGCLAGGLLIQHLPNGEEGRERLHVQLDDPDWQHAATLANTMGYAELVDSTLSMEALVWRLFHEEETVLIERGALLERGCRCSADHYRTVISRFPENERAEMRNEEGQIVVDCAFCSKEFVLDL